MQSKWHVPSLSQTPPAFGHVAAQSAAASTFGASGGASTMTTSVDASLAPSPSVTTSDFTSGDATSFTPPSSSISPDSARLHAQTIDAMETAIHLEEPTHGWLHNADVSQ